MKIRKNKNIKVVNDVFAIIINDPNISTIQEGEEEEEILIIIVMFINDFRID